MTEPVTPAYARLPVDDLTPHPRNVREGDVGAIAASLREFGQYRPIVVQPTGVIVAGTHTWLAHQALRESPPPKGWDAADWRERWSAIDVVTVDVDDATALRLMLADNRTHDLGRDRPDELAVLLAELGVAAWPGTGYDGDDLDTILRDLGTYDPGAGILSAFDGVTGAGADEGTFADATHTGRTEHVAFTVSLTYAQRGALLEAFKSAKAQGYATQPEALEAMARRYMEDPR